MEKDHLKDLVEKGFSIAKIAENKNCSKSNARYWLKKYNLKTNTTRSSESHRSCFRCKEFKSRSEYYSRRGVPGSSPYCKVCTNDQTKERQRACKAKAIAYKGGCCEICSYSKYQGSLDFHHRNPEEKDFSISSLKLKKLDGIVKKELDKCMLLCSNCHREEHARMAGILP